MDFLTLQGRLQPDRLAAVDLASGQRWNYAVFERAAGQYAAALAARGVGAGQRVAALAKNHVSLILLHLACARLGAMYVPLNWRLAAAELAGLVEDAEPALLLGDPGLLEANGLSGISLGHFAAGTEALTPWAGTQPDDAVSLILYTSGTSGRPKGVLLTERNIWATALNFSLLARVTHESAIMSDVPMFHVVGLVTTIRPALMRGGAFLISDGFQPARTLARLGDSTLGVTHYFCVPQMAATLRAEPDFDPTALARLSGVFSGGAPHAAAAIRAWTDAGIPLADGYGMSECGTVSCMPLDRGLINDKAGSAGLVPPGVRVRIVDPAGADVPAGEAGEILVAGENVTAGYWRRPAESAAAFADGWLRSGDVGRLDEDGFLWLLDRRKDMFISGGENVYPAEIEGVLAAHPGLTECAVIGVADARWGEVGHLAAVMRGDDVDAAGLTAFLEARLARYKIPKHVTLLDRLPRNGAGKVDKRALREQLT